MNKLILILITLNVSLYLYGQDPVKVYFEEHFQTVENKPTSYYRLYDINKSGASIKDYSHDIIELEARINGLTDVDSLNKFIWFIRNEQVKINFEEYFKYVTGEFLLTDTQNKTVYQTEFKDNEYRYLQITDADGKNYLTNGNGDYNYKVFNRNEYVHQVFKDYKVQKSFILVPSQQDTLYSKVDKYAIPYGGYQKFYSKILKTLKYPVLKQLTGQEERVYIQFTVDKTGTLKDFEALTETPSRFHSKTIKKLAKLDPWKPAELEGRPVSTRFILPVTFELY